MRWRYALSLDHQVWLANDCILPYMILWAIEVAEINGNDSCQYVSNGRCSGIRECVIILVLMHINIDIQLNETWFGAHTMCCLFLCKF